jgi:hypothetical protein
MDKDQFTAAELFRAYVEESVAGSARQLPEYNPLRNSGHESGDFVFVRVKPGDKTAEAKAATQEAAAATPSPGKAEASAERAAADAQDSSTPQGREIAEPNSNDLTGSTWWTGNSPTAGLTGEFFIEFLKDGQLHYVTTVRENGETKQRIVKGTWRQSGEDVQIVIGNAFSVLQGKFDGSTIKAEGENMAGDKLKWLLFKKLK